MGESNQPPAGARLTSTAAPSDPGALLGTVLGGKYQILEVIARGGMGTIFLAEQRPLGRRVAIKVLHPRLGSDEETIEFQRRFLLEAATLSKLAHPNIVVVHDYGQIGDGVCFMAMEYLQGRTLSAELKHEGPFSPGRAVFIAREITRALRAAHRIEVVHRDLKPANVMLDSEHGDEESVKVLDFGLVKVLRDETEELTQEGRFLGSPKYMAPEQIRKAPVDGRTDLYALGVILYQMLTGGVPFRGEQSVQTLMAHLVDPVPPLTPPPGVVVPPALEQLVMRCLEKDRDKRPASADEVLVALERIWKLVGDGRPIESSGSHDALLLEDAVATDRPPPSESGSLPTLERTSEGPTQATLQPPPRRRPALWITLGVVGLTVAGALVVALGWDVGEKPADERVRPAGPAREVLPRETPPVPEAPPPEPEREVVEAPPPAPRTFRLTIESEPQGAIVFRDADDVGRTPLTLELDATALRARPAVFSVRRRGYESHSFIQGPATEHVVVTARLRRVRGGGGGDPLIKTQR